MSARNADAGRQGLGVWTLVGREIRHRKPAFVIGLLCVAVAIATLAGAVTLLSAHETRTEEILAERERETREEMNRLENDYRRIMRDMGHNVMVLHENQSLAALRSAGHPNTYMPEEYVYELATGGIETLNHLLPVLQERITWPGRDLEIILNGTPGQVPVYHLARFLTEDGTAYRNPIIEAVPEGSLNLGHAVAQELGLQAGDMATLMGETFRIHRVNRPQGNEEDIMVWCGLDKAQEWLGRKGQINAIFALECICDIDALGQITEEVHGILSDVQVLEFSSRVIARGQARQRAEAEARRAIAAEINHRQEMGEARRAFTSILIPVVLLASGLWIFFLILGNVRERESEIGILRAIGVTESKIAAVFLCKAAVLGVIGAAIGYFAGVTVGAAWAGISPLSMEFVRSFNPLLFLASLLVAVALCAVSGWVPALKASHKDPADILREL